MRWAIRSNGPRFAGTLLLALSLTTCTGRARAHAPAAAPPVQDPPAIHWTRTSAEHRAAFEQTYRWIAQRVGEQAEGRHRESWAVILDADETLLDTSGYQWLRARQGLGYSAESWDAWVREESAPALPGAVEFVTRVRDLGGRVTVVTNRDERLCAPTRRNLVAQGLLVDLVLCRQAPGGKDSRFTAIAQGTAPGGLPPLDVLAWVGDNIEDFPGGSQRLAEVPAERFGDFGVRFFVLPNPMYGSWERNPPRASR